MRRSVTHLRMHDKVLLDFPVATVCSLLMLLNMHVRTHTCAHTHNTLSYVIENICQRILRQQMVKRYEFGLAGSVLGPFTAVRDSARKAKL